jgi:polar amino acid transport system substrate-binding protein
MPRFRWKSLLPLVLTLLLCASLRQGEAFAQSGAGGTTPRTAPPPTTPGSGTGGATPRAPPPPPTRAVPRPTPRAAPPTAISPGGEAGGATPGAAQQAAISPGGATGDATSLTALPTGEIAVGTRAIEPFIMEQGAQISGFSADLWRAITAELGLKSRFVLYKTLPELLGSVAKGETTTAIAAISITADREKTFEFSQPMFRSGLSIMVPDDGQQLDVLGQFLSLDMLKAVGIFLLILIIPAHLIWLLARGRDEGLPISRSYVPGIFDSVFWCAESMGGAAQAHPKRVVARIVAVIWVYAGLVFVTFFTAYATTTLTMQGLKGAINGPNDLAGKRVAVVQGSTSARYTEGLRARTASFPDFKTAAESMLAGKADAVVYDAPVILYYTKNHTTTRIAGSTFRSENYGILFPLNSPLRRPVNEALLRLVENGVYDSLYKKWFGEENGTAN